MVVKLLWFIIISSDVEFHEIFAPLFFCLLRVASGLPLRPLMTMIASAVRGGNGTVAATCCDAAVMGMRWHMMQAVRTHDARLFALKQHVWKCSCHASHAFYNGGCCVRLREGARGWVPFECLCDGGCTRRQTRTLLRVVVA